MNHMNHIGFVFIHGAGLGSYIWDSLVEEMAVPCLTVDFPQRSPDTPTDPPIHLKDYLTHVLQQITEWKVEKFIIVAHSIGGSVGLMVAEALKDRVVGFVGLGAVIPGKGGSFISALPFPQNLILPIILRIAGTRPPDKIILSSLCHGLSKDQSHQILGKFTPESKYLFTDPCSANLPNTYRVYIHLQDDLELSPKVQSIMASNLQADQVYSLPGGHLPMISHKSELNTLLHKIHQTTESTIMAN